MPTRAVMGLVCAGSYVDGGHRWEENETFIKLRHVIAAATPAGRFSIGYSCSRTSFGLTAGWSGRVRGSGPTGGAPSQHRGGRMGLPGLEERKGQVICCSGDDWPCYERN